MNINTESFGYGGLNICVDTNSTEERGQNVKVQDNNTDCLVTRLSTDRICGKSPAAFLCKGDYSITLW